MEIPVYLFTGFMDSGKTSLLKETLFINGFAEDLENFLVILCEEGEEEIDTSDLKKLGGEIVFINSEDELCGDNLKKLDDAYSPEAVFIEFNGTWPASAIYDVDAPEEWTIVQSLCTVDSGTFLMYMQNMRNMMVEQMQHADVIIFNRFSKEFSKSQFRANVKAINRPAQIVYELEDGSIDESEEELPFDISSDELEISDSDYALWYMDCMDHPEKYDGKTVSFLAMVYNPSGKNKLKPDTIIPGRFAMTCCVEDIQFLGIKCITKNARDIKHKAWIKLTAKVKKEYAKEYKKDGPVLYAIKEEASQGPGKDEELVYFN